MLAKVYVTLKNGVLSVVLPLREAKQPRQIAVQSA